jgi:hypothetical protein
MSKTDAAGTDVSAIPPVANINEIIMPRQSLKKPTLGRPFPKFDVLISLPPYLLQVKGFIFLSPFYIAIIT